MPVSRRSVLTFALGASLIFPAISSAGPAQAAERIKAVASFSILGDLVRQVGGERVEVTVLVGPNGDAHVFSPAPADAAKVTAARILFVNGLGLEGWMDRFIKASGSAAPVVVASTGVKPQEGVDEDHGAQKGHAAHHLDPHAWQSVGNVMIYVANIRDALANVDPTGKETYEANATKYLAQLKALDAEIKAMMAKIPPERRRIITTHDAFGYFAAAYGMQVIAPQGVSTDAEASAGDVARIIRQIKAQKIPAVFIENISDDRLMQRIAKETGARIGGKIYSDALSEPAGPAGTYLDMIRNNIKAFSAALTD